MEDSCYIHTYYYMLWIKHATQNSFAEDNYVIHIASGAKTGDLTHGLYTQEAHTSFQNFWM